MNNRLKSVIVLRFGTQSDFAHAIDVRESRVSRIVRGRENLRDEEQIQWAAALQVNAAELFNEK